MTKVHQIDVPSDSLLESFGGEGDYRDCFVREVSREISLAEFVERFYTSTVFRPERVVLRLIGNPASREDARKLALDETDRFGVWKVVERRPAQILLESRPTGTASWFAVEPCENGTRLLFGSWVGNLDQSGWRSLERAHTWYSELLLGGVEFG